MLDAAEARRIAGEWVDAWNRHDLEAILDHYRDNVEVVSPLVVERYGTPDGTLHGKEQLRDYFSRGLANAELHFELQDVLIGVQGIAICYVRETGVSTVDALTLDGDGKVLRAVVFYGQ